MGNTEQFFKDIFGERHIDFRCIGKGGRPIDANGLYNENIVQQLRKVNDQGYEVYFIVNSGGYKDNDITAFNAVFIDLDCGRDKTTGDYFSLEVVQGYKDEKLKELNDFLLKPSYIVETRNGLHVYWLLQPNTTLDQFSMCEELLISYFNADLKVKNPARLLRVPSYNWNKDPENPFRTSIIVRNDMRYEIEEIINSFPSYHPEDRESVGEGFSPSNKKEYTEDNLIGGRKTPGDQTNQPSPFQDTIPIQTSNKHKQYIFNRNSDALEKSIDADSIILQTGDEVYDYLKKQDLRRFLGVHEGGTFHCLFHNDKSPSAGIFINQETGHHIYKCHSGNCDTHGTIIELAGRMTNLNLYKTMQLLRQVYRIEIADSAWKKEQTGILQENMDFLLRHGDMKDYHPEMYERIHHYLQQLYWLHGFSKNKVVTENFISPDGEPIFFASNRYIAEQWGLDSKTTTQRLAYLTYLGLLKKWTENDVPSFLIKQAKHEAAKKKQKYIINFYSIPAFGEGLFDCVKMKALEYKAKGFTMKGFSRELLLRSLGMEEADRVYPRLEGKPLSEFSEELCRGLEKLAHSLIKEKGWTSEKEIIALFDRGDLNEVSVETQLKKMIPEMLEKYSLKKTRLNKVLKAELGIEVEGYPYVIIPNE
ncbi:hypothetical protein [Paenibacillus sp. FSL L8-0506]|uniref:hypothetical protein n=1 Tax=Paenibacillus sp. FSL L8-0506 TaxID=2975335 RepID=UPI0030F581FD